VRKATGPGVQFTKCQWGEKNAGQKKFRAVSTRTMNKRTTMNPENDLIKNKLLVTKREAPKGETALASQQITGGQPCSGASGMN